MECHSYCTADTYNIPALQEFLERKFTDVSFHEENIYLKLSEDSSDGHIFYFPYGCVVFWNVTTDQQKQFLKELQPFHNKPLVNRVRDFCFYELGEETMIDEEHDMILLESDDSFLKLSLSYAMSQSVKLRAFEHAVSETIENNKHLPQELAEKGKTSLSRRKLAQKVGALFSERTSINLSGDTLNTPRFFWRRPRYEPIYHMAAIYLDLTTRMDILNRKLEVIHELYSILSEELKHIHSSRLELTIIFLIVTEVALTILKDIMKLF